jgi:hypothetical protein
VRKLEKSVEFVYGDAYLPHALKMSLGCLEVLLDPIEVLEALAQVLIELVLNLLANGQKPLVDPGAYSLEIPVRRLLK